MADRNYMHVWVCICVCTLCVQHVVFLNSFFIIRGIWNHAAIRIRENCTGKLKILNAYQMFCFRSLNRKDRVFAYSWRVKNKIILRGCCVVFLTNWILVLSTKIINICSVFFFFNFFSEFFLSVN